MLNSNQTPQIFLVHASSTLVFFDQRNFTCAAECGSDRVAKVSIQGIRLFSVKQLRESTSIGAKVLPTFAAHSEFGVKYLFLIIC